MLNYIETQFVRVPQRVVNFAKIFFNNFFLNLLTVFTVDQCCEMYTTFARYSYQGSAWFKTLVLTVLYSFIDSKIYGSIILTLLCYERERFSNFADAPKFAYKFWISLIFLVQRRNFCVKFVFSKTLWMYDYVFSTKIKDLTGCHQNEGDIMSYTNLPNMVS